jgi:hypothetical protein
MDINNNTITYYYREIIIHQPTGKKTAGQQEVR